jgi:hypothetical protein
MLYHVETVSSKKDGEMVKAENSLCRAFQHDAFALAVQTLKGRKMH